MVALSVAAASRPATREEDEDPQSKRDQIVGQAIVMFSRLGYHGTRVGDITEALNMGKSSFYLHFRSKKELLLTCFSRADEFAKQMKTLPEAQDGDFVSATAAWIRIANAHAWWSDLLNLLRAAESSPDLEIRTKAREAQEIVVMNLKHDLEEAIEAGRVRSINTELAAYGFQGFVDNLWLRSRFVERYTPDLLYEFMVDWVERWLGADTPREEPVWSRPDHAAHLVLRDGTEFDLRDLRCNGETHVTGVLGLGEIDIDLGRLSHLVVTETADGCLADVTLTNETAAQLRLDGSIIVSGENHLGRVRVTLGNLSSLKRD